MRATRPYGAIFLSVTVGLSLFPFCATGADSPKKATTHVDFNRDIRPILSENCYKCHGPDDGARKARLRFDIRAEALKPAKSGEVPIVPGSPEKSQLVARITATDPDERMPSVKSGKTLSPTQIDLLKRWVAEGAPYATHWSYVKPVRPVLPQVKRASWPQNPIDRFILARLEHEGLKPSLAADRFTMIRRVSLDLTGLPPTPEEVDRFVKDKSPRAYEELVDRLLKKPAFGEHWARMWLDLARYADSAGYADDPPRTIWPYRDYVIRSLNANKHFDRFTLEQIAGDLLDDGDEDDLIGCAFHRNTMTNNEGGTSDEEFRNAAVVDRVNTTMAVWMGTSIACAQCHNHKYDPITQQDYFRMFAILNNTADADLKDESPLFEIFTPAQKKEREKLQGEITVIETKFRTPTPESLTAQAEWEKKFPGERQWLALAPLTMKSESGGLVERASENAVKAAPQLKTETYRLEFAQGAGRVAGVRLEVLPGEKFSEEEKRNAGYSISQVQAMLITPFTNRPLVRYVRLELPGADKILSLAEVEIYKDNTNIATKGEASQSSTAFGGEARFAIDGNKEGDFDKKSTTHTEQSNNPWWELDLKTAQKLDRITIWNRTDHDLQSRLAGVRLELLDENRKVLWLREVKEAPSPKVTYGLNGMDPLQINNVFADTPAGKSDLKALVQQGDPNERKGKGWAVNSDDGKSHYLTLLMEKPIETVAGSKLQIVIEQKARHDHCPPTLFRISSSQDEHMAEYATLPEVLLHSISKNAAERSDTERASLSEYYRANVEPDLKPDRDHLAGLKKQMTDMPRDIVPVMRELTGDKRRETHIQFRGNYLSLGDTVTAAVPAAFNALPKDSKPDRVGLARWLIDKENPLTARVMANRLWEQIFGIGIVRTSEEFGSQGELPTNPELLDWLACQFRDGDELTAPWDVKAFLKLLVTSATYRQSSRVTPELKERDSDNVLLARGPRFRMSAEVVHDQALAVSGLLSQKMFGPPVRPPQPSLGLTAAFGGSLDWKTSEGEDRYRRGVYIEWRRTSPYPSMAAFDAPNREVCALRRTRSNTPLQALVTMNDPVFVEAAQALGKRIATATGSKDEKMRYGFRLCLARQPRPTELKRLVSFYDQAKADYISKPDKAKEMAGTAPEKGEIAELAAWTAIGNVLLNLDETLMRP
jgi:mono/diheme cytochrome c family protein